MENAQTASLDQETISSEQTSSENSGIGTTQTEVTDEEGTSESVSNPLAEVNETSQDATPQKSTILVVHASVGSGHRSAAYAVAQAFDTLEESFPNSDISVPDDLEVEVLDILDFGRIVFDGDKTASMFTGFTRPVYDLTWRFTLTGRVLWGGGTVWARVMFPKFTEYIAEKQPIAVICTHITAANATVGARMLTDQRFPILCVPTDYETEGFWPHKTADLFCVANEFMAETLRPRKVPESKIKITGIPTKGDFGKSYDKGEAQDMFGLPHDKTIVLVLVGAHLPRPYVRMRETIDKALPYLHSFENMHFVFVAGSDAAYSEHLKQSCDELGFKNVTVFEYVDDVALLMAASDLVICKSGGLTVTECLCAQIPMILLGRAYGQEKANVRMLTSVGAAMHVTTARELVEAIRHISTNPQHTQAMLISGRIARRPHAAATIAYEALKLSEKAKAGDLPVQKKRFLHFYWGRKPAHER